MTEVREPSTGGLIVPPGLGAARSALREIFARFATSDRVLDDLEKSGIKDPVKPQFDLPEVTVDALTTTNSRDYAELFAKQLAWFNYLTQTHALSKIMLLEAENILDLVENAIKDALLEENKLRDKAEKMSAGEIATKVKVHPDYVEALEKAQEVKQYKLRLDAHVDVADRNMKVISREVEMKKIEAEGAARESSIGRFRRPVTR